MKLKLLNNWVAKLLSLLLATAIWFLIKGHLTVNPTSRLPFMQQQGPPPPRAVPVDESTLR